MSVYRIFCILFLFAILLSSCSVLSSDSEEILSNEDSQIVTDQDVYTTAFKHATVSPQDTFRFEIRFNIIASYQNNTEQRVYLSQCLKGKLPGVMPEATTMGIVHASDNDNVEKARLLRISGGLADTGCFSNHQPAVKVEPGQVLVDTIRVTSELFSEEGFTRIGDYSASDLDGNYQLIYGGGTCLEEGSDRVIPENCIFLNASDIPRSNVFEVRVVF
jgi:hypothetical protein